MRLHKPGCDLVTDRRRSAQTPCHEQTGNEQNGKEDKTYGPHGSVLLPRGMGEHGCDASASIGHGIELMHGFPIGFGIDDAT